MAMNNIKRWHLLAGVLGVAVGVAAGSAYLRGAYAAEQTPDASAGRKGADKGTGKGANGGGRPVPVALAAAASHDVRVTQSALGTVTALASVTVHARVGGQLQRVLFEEGQFVKAGQVLAEVDPRPFSAQLAQAEGQLKRDVALLKNAQADLARYQGLHTRDAVSAQQVDTQAALVQQYQGTVQADQGAVDNARLQLDFTRITAPVSGRIGLRQVDVGNIVSPTDSAGLAVITAVQPINAVFSLPEDLLPTIAARLAGARKAGQALAIEAWDRGGTRLLARGQLQTIDNRIDPTTGTVKFKAVFANGDGALYPNQFVNLRLLVETRPDSVVAPNVAIQRGNQGAFVYVVADDKTARLRPVTLGAVDGDRTAITSGLQAGERVVVNGIDKLRDGAKVAVPAAKAERQGRPG
jgi:multidrug efflux system membrane fusion protein